MLMSKSRLEKFLYALYSLDSSDLPTPLSRIEELYKCWVTGEEAPTFEPLSRVEKYLMAILGGYDVDSLPNPISRVEVLLYKLATGDDNLEDIDSFLSEHEELLAEIIRNRGVGGNIDIEYVSYTLSTESNTLYNTAEKPVKSAILKGNTLVNLLNKLTVNGEVGQTTNWYTTTYTTGTVKSGTYILLYHVKETSGTMSRNTPGIRLADGTYLYHGYEDFNTTTGIKKWIFTANEDLSEFGYWLTYNTGKVVVEDFILLEYQEGMENWDIPFFEGIKSVKMPVLTTIGKNLLNNQNNSKDTTIGANGKVGTYVGRTLSDYVKVSKNKQYAFSGNGNSGNYVAFFDNSKTFIERLTVSTFTPKQDGYIRVFQYNSVEALYQIEEGSVATEYEPYKTNILSVNEEVELRGIGNVKDELDLTTGELTERIGEIVLDGSENWIEHISTTSEVLWVYMPFQHGGGDGVVSILCDKFKIALAKNAIYLTGQNIMLRVDKNEYSIPNVYSLKTYLQSNPLTVQYVLATESVKTVDLSVLDQDGNNTKLSTFDDITHVILSSEGLIPEAELEVATKNEEVLSTMSLEMNDISTTQNALQETSNIQSENVDATMIATTEIYEELL